MASFKGILEKVKGFKFDRPSSNSVILYLFFVVISSILWCFLTFNRTVTVDMEVPVVVSGKPSNVRFLSQVPDTITVNVTNRGTYFLKYVFLSSPKLELKFSDYCDGNGVFRVDAVNLKKALSRILARNSINSVLPDNITARYTDQPGKLVPIILDMDIEPARMYALTGVIERSQDSVLVYGDNKTLKGITEVYSYHVSETGLTDTLRRKVTIAPLKGVVVEPRTIDVMIPVEKLVTKTQKVQVSVRNAPHDVKVVVFPSKVDATFRVPTSYFKNNTQEITAVVDYNSINLKTQGNKVQLLIGEVPGAYEDVHLSLDSVEYIIERQ